MKLLHLFSFLLIGITGFGQGYWETINPYPTAQHLRGASFVSPDTGWLIAANGNLLKTVNGGQAWDFQLENFDGNFMDIFFINENEGWICGKKKVFRTSDGGDNWETHNLPGQYLSTASIYFINTETGWACGSYDRIHKTVNGGVSWQLVHSGYYTEATYLEDIEFYDENHGIAVGGYIVGTDTAVILTTDNGGETWNRKTFPQYKALKAVTYVSENTIIAIGYHGNIFRSTDGGETWDVQVISYSWLTDVHFFNESDGIVLSSSELWRTNDGGISWTEGEYLNADHFSFSGSTGYAFGYLAEIYKTEDNGSNWNLISKNMALGNLTNAAFADTLTIWACRQNDTQLVKTSDGGYNWEIVNIGASGDILDMCFPSQEVG